MTKTYRWVVGVIVLWVGGMAWTAGPTAAQEAETDCVAVVGDSVAYGTLVFEVPGFGFFVARTQPLSAVLQEGLDAAGYDLEVRDYSVAASYLSPEGSLVYATTPEYEALLEDRCRYVVINAFINDLTLHGPGAEAEPLVDLLAELMGALAFVRPDVQVALVAYFDGLPAGFVPEYRGNVITTNMPVFNTAIFEACAEGGQFQKFADVTCIDIEAVFVEMNFTHVVAQVGRNTFYAILYEGMPQASADAFRIYWEQNPTAVVNGDGMHLSEAGKQAWVETVLTEFFGYNENDGET